jgi:hypothetical protein
MKHIEKPDFDVRMEREIKSQQRNIEAAENLTEKACST